MGGGGAKSRLCATHYPLNPKLSLYTLLFAFYFFVVASECIAQAWQSIKSTMLRQIDCHAKNRLCSFLLAMMAHFVILSVAKNPHKLKENLPFMDTSLTLSMTANASLRAVFAKTAWQSINLALFLLFGLPRSLCSLAMTARQKFKFFTQNSRHSINLIHFVNSRHFINPTHFINLFQISSPTQGFFIPLPQIFAQFLLINSTQKEKQWLSQKNSKGI